jgi:hypothetical protein
MTVVEQRRIDVATSGAARPSAPFLGVSFSQVLPLARVAVLMLGGAMPVSAIPLYVVGWLSMTDAALFCVLPLSLISLGLMLHRSPEGVWAVRGFAAGLVAVLAYDCLRMPLVWAGVWPDFIPRLGGSISGDGGNNALIGYAWRYIGDGGGIGIAFFVFCSVVMAIRPALLTARPVLASVGYGVFIWTGLLATVELPARGEELLFRVTPTSFALSLLGHLVYGTVLGVFLRHHLRGGPPETFPAGAAGRVDSGRPRSS